VFWLHCGSSYYLDESWVFVVAAGSVEESAGGRLAEEGAFCTSGLGVEAV